MEVRQDKTLKFRFFELEILTEVHHKTMDDFSQHEFYNSVFFLLHIATYEHNSNTYLGKLLLISEHLIALQ